MRESTLRAVLFDSGGVLIRPIGDRWNPRADFEPTVLSHYPGITLQQFAGAISAGERFLSESPSTPDTDAYHRAILDHLGIEPTEALLAELKRPVEPSTILETFPDVLPVLSELRDLGIRMAVVSDAWPNLPELHAALGIGGFFETYAISAELGCRKPDPQMYHHASSALGLEPEQCLFIDDDPLLVKAAMELGYAGRALCRTESADLCDVPYITTLDGLPRLFKA